MLERTGTTTPIRSALGHQRDPPSTYPQQVVVMARNRFVAKCLDFVFRDAAPPHGLAHLADDAEVIAGTIKSHKTRDILRPSRATMRRYVGAGKLPARRANESARLRPRLRFRDQRRVRSNPVRA
jgi:hypothetical protein